MQTRIATGGKAGAGKDFVLSILVQYHARQGKAARPATIGGFGNLVRMDWNKVHQTSGTREDWQRWGQLRRAQDEEFWLKAAVTWADGFGPDTIIGFSGVRFENELTYLQANGFLVGLVRAPELVRVKRLYRRDGRWWTDEELKHRTETALDEIPLDLWDFVIDNG